MEYNGGMVSFSFSSFINCNLLGRGQSASNHPCKGGVTCSEHLFSSDTLELNPQAVCLDDLGITRTKVGLEIALEHSRDSI